MTEKTLATEEPPTSAWTITGFTVNLSAADLKEAIAFYTALGFEESFRVPTEGTPRHVEVKKDGVTIGLNSLGAFRDELGFEASQEGASVELVLWCNDSDAAYAQALAAGAPTLREPYDFLNGRLHVARVFDPLGNPLAFVQKRGASS